ncbi:uncharacterized protein PV07_04187 [Cladophialophora immunda]|uniref:Arrestin-like N-terminal domain-containing protein n=1 Tax=Cladophialophora immunda TaxID=569365 RepID=A0A0D2CN42_9EURO|nr:uncharacterized protein PV07_04187 [Cladophialophora immunda]KIW32658.1 hypothetical protein PV07_04187 [Cladophialophora immunda]OQV03545.1 hypothetical protein CLAIMM_08578 [Cladophialophora immunda]
MRLALDLDRSDTLGPYSQLDDVSGVVRFQSDWSSISRIQVSLQGRIHTYIKHDAKESSLEESSGYNYHKFFKESLTIFPPPGVVVPPHGFSLSRRKLHSFPFKLKFPASTSCLKNRRHASELRLQLPPTFSIDTKPLNAKIVYWLRVKVKRNFGFPRQLLLQKDLEFAPLFSPTVSNLNDLSLTPGYTRHNFRELGNLELRAELDSRHLCVGDELTLTLNLRRSSTSGSHHLRVYLQAIEIDLQTIVTVIQPTQTSKISSVLAVAKWTPRKEIDISRGMASYRIPDDSLSPIMMPETSPGFIACAVSVKHNFRIHAGLSLSTSGAHQVVQCDIPVAISNGRAPRAACDTTTLPPTGPVGVVPPATVAQIQDLGPHDSGADISPGPPPYSEA